MSATFQAETMSRREFGIALDLVDHGRDLVEGAAVRAFPGAPLLAVDRAEFAALVGPFVPDRDVVGLEIGDVGLAIEEPDQFVDDRTQMQLLGRDQRKALRKIEAKLAAEQRANARARPVALDGAGLQRFAQQDRDRPAYPCPAPGSPDWSRRFANAGANSRKAAAPARLRRATRFVSVSVSGR